MKWVYHILLLLFGLLLGYFLFGGSSKNITTTKEKIIYQDTGSYHVSIKPIIRKEVKIKYKHDTIKVIVLQKIDSMTIVKDYLLAREFRDTIVNDTSMFIAYNAFVSMNNLDSIHVERKNRRATSYTIINNTIIKSKYGVGILLEGNKTEFDITPIVTITHKRLSYIFGYGINRKIYKGGLIFNF